MPTNGIHFETKEDRAALATKLSSGKSSSGDQRLVNGSVTKRTETGDQTAKLIYLLNWTTRDEIIAKLNRYTQLLCGKRDETETKEKLMYDSVDLYQVLISLPLKSDASPGIRHPNNVVLDLDFRASLQIVITLFANHSLVFDCESASEESKRKMIEQNNELIVRLIRLPFNAYTGPAEQFVLNDNANRLTKPSEWAGEVAKLNRIIEDQKSALAELTERASQNSNSEATDQLEKEIMKLRNVEDLNKMVQVLRGHVYLGVNRKRADFECELDGVEAFLESNVNRISEHFFAGQLAWHLEFKTKVDSQCKFLSIYLHSKKYAGRSGDWSVRASFDVSLISQAGGHHRLSRATQDFGTKSFMGWGWAKFISADALKSGGYIKDGKIKLRVHLQILDPVKCE